MIQDPFTYGNIYDTYNEDRSLILFPNLSEKYLYYKKEFKFRFRIIFFLNPWAINLKRSWMSTQCVEKHVPSFWKMGLISLELIPKPLKKVSLETKGGFKTTVAVIMVDAVSDAM